MYLPMTADLNSTQGHLFLLLANSKGDEHVGDEQDSQQTRQQALQLARDQCRQGEREGAGVDGDGRPRREIGRAHV